MATENSACVRSSQDDTISQSEVERLLAQMGTSEAEPSPLRQTERADPASCKRHNFPPFSFFSAGELRKLRVRHEAFLRSLTARLSLHLRQELSLQMSRFEALSFQKFVDGLCQPSHLTLVSLEPLEGTCLLEIPPRLGLTVVDRELGGPGVCLEDGRELNQTEVRVLSQVVEIIISEWCGSWSGLMDLRPVMLGHESSGRYLQICPPAQTMLILGIEVRMGDQVEQMQLALAHLTLKPLMLKLSAEQTRAEQPPVVKPNAPLKWNPVLGDVKILVSAELPKLVLSARQLAHLKPGDVLPIPIEMTRQVRICLERAPKFEGTLGNCGPRRAVKIEHILTP